MNFPSVGPSRSAPFHGVQSLRNTLLQCGSLMVSQFLAENLSLCGLQSMTSQVLPGDCSNVGSPWGHNSFKAHPSAPLLGSSTGCRWISAPPLNSMGCSGQLMSPWSSPRTAGESLLQHLEYVLYLLLH